MGEKLEMYSFDFLYKDTLCATVHVYKDGIVEVDNYAKDVLDLPFGVKTKGITGEDLAAFLEWRCVPRGRANIRQLLDDMGLQFYNPIDIVRKTHGVMCDDMYWIRFSGERLCWNDVNPLNFI